MLLRSSLGREVIVIAANVLLFSMVLAVFSVLVLSVLVTLLTLIVWPTLVVLSVPLSTLLLWLVV
jgi:hypothetical protein